MIVVPGRCPQRGPFCVLQVLDRGAQAVARGGARCASQGCVHLLCCSDRPAVASYRAKYVDEFKVQRSWVGAQPRSQKKN
jgi:hypothetical protein